MSLCSPRERFDPSHQFVPMPLALECVGDEQQLDEQPVEGAVAGRAADRRSGLIDEVEDEGMVACLAPRIPAIGLDQAKPDDINVLLRVGRLERDFHDQLRLAPMRAVTSISIFMASSIILTMSMEAAGRMSLNTAPTAATTSST